ncbi:hypothetical protein ACRAWC_01590 [Leifsonia sp. L25]|uniref:hypothetical protein n=1 Tax=Leifsonia sp. L25 TaxID=3423957 RepID=UPI003D69F151
MLVSPNPCAARPARGLFGCTRSGVPRGPASSSLPFAAFHEHAAGRLRLAACSESSESLGDHHPMPVSFTTAPDPRPEREDPKSAVRRLLAANRSRSPVNTVLAVLCGLLPTMAAASVRRLVLSVTDADDPVRRIADDSVRWASSVTTASQYLKGTPSASDKTAVANRRVEVATSLLSLLLSPAPARATFVEAKDTDVAAGRAAAIGDPISKKLTLSARADVQVRALTALLGVQILTDKSGFDSALASRLYLAPRLNLGERATWSLLKQATTFGFLRQAGKTSRGVNRYRLGSRGPGTELEIGDAYIDTITALAIGDTSDPLAELILSVGHLTWAYASTPGPDGTRVAAWDGYRGWFASVLALAAAAAKPNLGMPAATRARLRKKVGAEFAKAGLPGIGRGPLEPQLGALSESTLAAYVYADAMETAKVKREQVAAERDEFVRGRAAQRKLEKRLDETFFTDIRDRFGALPDESWDRERFQKWWKKVHPWWVEHAQPLFVNEKIAATIRGQLEWRLTQRNSNMKDFVLVNLPWTVDAESTAASFEEEDDWYAA